MEFRDREKKVLPSRRFVLRSALVIIVVAVFIISQTSWFKKTVLKKESVPSAALPTVVGVVSKDTNQNGILDWEERLWGLDPTKTFTKGVSNKQIVEERKRAIGVNPDEEETLTETEKAARELFVVSAAFGTEEGDTTGALAELSKKMASGAEVSVRHAFALSDIATIPTTRKNLERYKAGLVQTLSRFEDMDSEIDVIASLENETNNDYARLETIGAQYLALARAVAEIKTPVGVAREHLGVANSYAMIGEALTLLASIPENAIRGATGASLYRAGSVALELYSNAITSYLDRYSIL